MHGAGGRYRTCRIHLSNGADRQKVHEGGREMTNQLHKGEVAQNLLERINELIKFCNDAETSLVIKDLTEARQILLNS